MRVCVPVSLLGSLQSRWFARNDGRVNLDVSQVVTQVSHCTAQLHLVVRGYFASDTDVIWGQFVNLRLIWFLIDRNPLLISKSSQLSLGLGNLLFMLLYKHLVISFLPYRSILYYWEYFLALSFLSRNWQVAPKTITVVNHDLVSLPYLLRWPIILEKKVMITAGNGRQHIKQPLAISLTFLEMVDQSLVHWFFFSWHINVVRLDEINKFQCDLQLSWWLWAATENELCIQWNIYHSIFSVPQEFQRYYLWIKVRHVVSIPFTKPPEVLLVCHKGSCLCLCQLIHKLTEKFKIIVTVEQVTTQWNGFSTHSNSTAR